MKKATEKSIDKLVKGEDPLEEDDFPKVLFIPLLIGLVLLVLCGTLTGCAIFDAAKTTTETIYEVGKLEGESVAIDEIERLQKKVLKYQKELNDARENGEPTQLQKEIKKKMDDLKEKVKELKRKNVDSD